MASFQYYLRRPEAKFKSSIVLYISYERRVAKYFTGISVDPELWDNQRKKIKGNAPWVEKTNRKLIAIEMAARDVYIIYQDENGDSPPPPKVLTELISDKLNRKTKEQKLTFISYFESIIELQKKRIANEGKGYRESSVPSYVNALNEVKDYAAYKKKRTLYFNDITIDFYGDFIDYLRDVKQLKYNTRGLRIRTVRTILRRAQASGTKIYVDLAEFKGFSEESDSIALTEEELNELAKLDLSGNLEEIRDVFLIGAWSGLRISDWKQMNMANIKDGMLRIKVKKTGRNLVIPLNTTVKAILKKYNYKLPSYADQTINRNLKDIGALLAERSKNITLEDKKERYAKLKSHVARRTFCTIMYYRGAHIDTIRAVSGHTTEKNFLTYIKVSPDEHAKNLKKFIESDFVPFKVAK